MSRLYCIWSQSLNRVRHVQDILTSNTPPRETIYHRPNLILALRLVHYLSWTSKRNLAKLLILGYVKSTGLF